MRIKEIRYLEKNGSAKSSKRCDEKRIDYKKYFQRMRNTCKNKELKIAEENNKRKFEDSSLIRQTAKRQKVNRCLNFNEEPKRLERLSCKEGNIVKSSKVLEMMSFVEENAPEKEPVPVDKEDKSESLPCVLIVMPLVIVRDDGCVSESPKKRSDEAITKKKRHKLEDRAVQDQIRNMISNFSELVLNDSTPKKAKRYESYQLQNMDVLQLITKYINLKSDTDLQEIRLQLKNIRA